MLISTDYVTPAELTGFARASLNDLEINRFRLSEILPSRTVDDLDYRFSRGGEGLIEAATYRAFDAESPITGRPGITRTQGSLPPISRKIRLGEYDRLRLRNANDAILNSLYTDTERVVRQIAARIEVARGQAIADARFTLEGENQVYAEVDFGRKASHTQTAATDWADTANAHPLLDLLGWQDEYVATNGEAPGSMLMSRQVFNLLLRSEEFRQLAGTQLGVPALVPATVVTQVLSAYGLPTVRINDQQITVGGSAQRVLPFNKVIFLPANVSDLGVTLWGTTAESLEPDFGIAGGDGPGIVAGSYSTKDPVAVWTKAAAIAMPVVVNPDLTFTATVTDL